ncbi:MAG: D-alanyl-D-alanine carboxypeptidase [Bacilli bacterium]|nr:D-alanyl-D-alanine carboxypeptidase [Bacilli bacterium]
MKKLLMAFILLLIPISSQAFSTSATSAILMDQDSGKVIYAKDIHNVRSIASISKIMTAILAVESGKTDDIVTIGSEINKAYGSGIYIKEGEEISLKDLIYGLMLRSGNDAALAIANYVGGSVDNFIIMMNKKAAEIGMKNTTFNNPSGLDDDGGNLSTAYDMALLTSYAMKNNLYKKIVFTKKYSVSTNMNVYSWTNKNKLLTTYKYTTGGKTGYTDIAKRTLVSTASKDNINLVVVTLNDGNDFLDHKSLYEEAFSSFKKYQILKHGNINIIDETYYNEYYLYIKEDYSYLMNNNELDSIYLKFVLQKKYNYKKDDIVGSVQVILGDEVIYQTDIYLGKEKEATKFSFFKWLKNLW